jgi:hypothetical protein
MGYDGDRAKKIYLKKATGASDFARLPVHTCSKAEGFK